MYLFLSVDSKADLTKDDSHLVDTPSPHCNDGDDYTNYYNNDDYDNEKKRIYYLRTSTIIRTTPTTDKPTRRKEYFHSNHS